MEPAVSLSEVSDQLDMQFDGTRIFLDRQTGEFLFLQNDALGLADEQAETEEKLETDPDRYARLPDKFEVHEWEIMERFARQVSDARLGVELENAIHGRGAFRMFKDVLYRRGIEQEWYDFKERVLTDMAREWLEAEKIPYRDDIEQVRKERAEAQRERRERIALEAQRREAKRAKKRERRGPGEIGS